MTESTPMSAPPSPHSGTVGEDGVHRLPVRVYYEDTDAGGIVYHSVYLNYAERGRTEFVRSRGICQRDLLADPGIAFAVRRCEVDFLRPARLEDDLVVETKVEKLAGSWMELRQTIRRLDDGTELVALLVKVACMTLAGRATRIPADIRAILQGHEPLASG